MSIALRVPRLNPAALIIALLVTVLAVLASSFSSAVSSRQSLPTAAAAIEQATAGLAKVGPTTFMPARTESGVVYALQHTPSGIRQLVSIPNDQAPTTYAFSIPVPVGGKVLLSGNGRGPAAIVNKNGQKVAALAAPWAKAANGPVATFYRWSSQRPTQLIQVVQHSITLGGQRAAYPVVADPDYGVDMTQACRYQFGSYQYFAWYLNVLNPFSWVCINPAIQWQNSGIVGGVDVQRYCSITHPGSRAVIVWWNVWGWRCRQ